MSSQPPRSGFSLLELMIVLTMMVGIGAIAWPSLRRPMADSSVQQAANQLRVQIADCRQSAAVEGQPRLMRFQAGQPSVGNGKWNDLVAEQLTESDSSGAATAALGEPPTSQEAEDWVLPIDIVVDEVQFDQQSYVETDESTDPLAQPREQPESNWYLPFLPSGQTRDAVIVLRDCATGSRVALMIEAVTGLMRTQRLSPAQPGDGPQIAAKPESRLSNELPVNSLDSQPSERVYSR